MATATSKPLIFISHSVQKQSLTSDFLERFERFHNGEFEIYHDRKVESGNFDDLILGKARSCQVAVLLISQSFITSTYCNEQELPIFMHRMNQNEVIIIPVLFQKCGFKKWNQDYKLKFFQLRNDDLPDTRRPDKYADRHNKADVVYQEIDEENFEGYHFQLSEYIKDCYQDFQNGIPALTISTEIQISKTKQQELRSETDTKKMLRKMKKNSLAYRMEEVLSKDPKLWEDAGIPIPGKDEIYGYRYCLGQDYHLKKIQEDIVRTPSDEFPVKVDLIYHKINHRDTILRSFIRQVYEEEEPIVKEMDLVLYNAKSSIEDAKTQMLKGIRQDANAPAQAKSKVIDTIGIIRDWVKVLREATLKTN